MDPLSAVSLAGTVVGLVDFLIKLITTGYHLTSERGISVSVYVKVETAAEDLTRYTSRLKPILQRSGETAPVQNVDGEFTEEEREVMRRVCDESEAIATRLSEVLEELQSKSRKPKSRAVRVMKSGIVAIWNKREIEELTVRVEELRQNVDSTIVRAMSRRLLDIKLDTSAILDKLDKQTRQITDSLLKSQKYIAEDSRSRDLAVAQLLSRCETMLAFEEYAATNRNNKPIGPVPKNRDLEKMKRRAKDETVVRQRATEEVLNSLWFASVAERFENIPEAHKKTFGWIFEQPPEMEQGSDEGTLWSAFVDWLESDSGLYWITGKAGSGKSTLMKYIVRHHRTEAGLSRWSDSHRLLMSYFFFWNSGSKEQRSQEGLLKSILFDILRQVPELVPVIFPLEWSKCYNTKLESAWSFQSNSAWSLSDLEIAFQKVITQRLIPMKVCLFIDGLDEYEGDDWRIADIVVKVADSENIKLCVSSRPHVVFEDTFAKLPRLRLQDLTKPDIIVYVSDLLLGDSRMMRLKQSSRKEAQGLVDRIVDGASGVFLWVTLVVTSLLRGLGNRDNIAILHQRLDELPTDLEQLFTQMIRKVERVYQSEASRLFQMVAMVTDELDTQPAEMSPLTLFWAFLAEAEEKFVYEPLERNTMTTDEIVHACKQMAVTVTSRSGGLLEVQVRDIEKVQPNTTILYLHRTVKDFMRQSEIRNLLSDRTGGHQPLAFKPSVALLRGAILYLGILKADIQVLSPRDSSWDRLYSNAIASAMQADRDTAEAPQVGLMSRFFEVVCLTIKDLRGWRSTGQGGGVHTLHDLPTSWAVLTRFGLLNTLDAKLRSLGSQVDTSTRKQISEALWYALDAGIGFGRPTTPAIVHLLLTHGADPNHTHLGSTGITQFLHFLESNSALVDMHRASKIVYDLYNHGVRKQVRARPLVTPPAAGRLGARYHGATFLHSSVVHSVFIGPEFAELRRKLFPDLLRGFSGSQAELESHVSGPRGPPPAPSLKARSGTKGTKRRFLYSCFSG